MKIFFIGKSGSGKTTLIKNINQSISDSEIISSSAWVRNSFRDKNINESLDIFNKKITEFALNSLKENHSASLTEINKLINNCTKSILLIDSIRNPYDFISLFNPKEDKVIVIDCLENNTLKTDFESGIDVIVSYMRWLSTNKLYDDFFKYFTLEYECKKCIQPFKGCDNNYYYCCLNSLKESLIKLYGTL